MAEVVGVLRLEWSEHLDVALERECGAELRWLTVYDDEFRLLMPLLPEVAQVVDEAFAREMFLDCKAAHAGPRPRQ